MNARMLAGVAAFCLGGCVAQQAPLYEWGTYSHDLLHYAKNPSEERKFSDALLVDVQKAEAVHKVPPGLYAEYGYTLLDLGDARGATDYFGRERDHWPESAPLMSRLIVRINAAPPRAEASATPAAAPISATPAHGGTAQ